MDSGSLGGGSSGSGGSNNNSSDFVRKLYKMLEDPSHKDIVRWSAAGDSFIVVDTNSFTTKILPQHFKHSNFASFVRQLNKYDFHKIKNTEEGAGSQYGEFKHPDFNKDSRDNLDNIRRKAPATRKNQQGDDGGVLDQLRQQVELLKEGSRKTDTQLQKLADQHTLNMSDFNQFHNVFSTHAEYIRRHDDVIQKLMSVVSGLSSDVRTLQRRLDGNQDGVSPSETGGLNSTAATSPQTVQQNGSTSPLQQSRRIMDYANNGKSKDIQSDPAYGAGAGLEPGFGSGMGPNGQNGLALSTIQSGVSQAGPSSYGGTFNNGGFMMTSQGNGSAMSTPRQMPGRKRSTPSNPQWIRPPHILLVEDDPTCRRIGSKFLANAQCAVDIADDGLIAVNKMHRHTYDLVLMDIMMPNLDGCSAAHLIRQFNQETPIIAMTSNIRRDDLNMYFNNGMNDVLPKPFTKDGLLQLLERRLEKLRGGSANEAEEPNQINIEQAPSQEPHLPEPHKSSATGKYPASSAAQKSPTNMYASTENSALTEDPAMAQAPTPVTMDDANPYMGMIPGYMEGDAHPSPFANVNPSVGQRRRREDMIGPLGAEAELFPDMKKQRF